MRFTVVWRSKIREDLHQSVAEDRGDLLAHQSTKRDIQPFRPPALALQNSR